MNISVHKPVLLREVLDALKPAADLVFVDGTVGGGGHALEIIKMAGPHAKLIGLDRDPMMLKLAHKKLTSATFKDHSPILEESHFKLVHAPYSQMKSALINLQVTTVDGILLDLGYSSDQLLDESRGFSFNHQEKLDLRFDITQGIPADEYLQTVDESTLKQVLIDYGEEPQAAKIAHEIVVRRKHIASWTPILLADLILQATGQKQNLTGIHPATRAFQALRIVINKELEILSDFLNETAIECLKPGGRLAIITFHSLEDRIVKQMLKDQSKWVDVPAKPISVTPQEARFNPRSRTAKLRIATFRG
jgi:16S rRNA (cytosine1402-N4)-methyltransferase